MPDYPQAVYDYLHTLGNVGDEVRTAIWPYLAEKYGLTPGAGQKGASRGHEGPDGPRPGRAHQRAGTVRPHPRMTTAGPRSGRRHAWG